MRVTPEQAAEAISLHNRMMACLAQMAVLPYGTTMNYNASGGRSSEHPGGRRPAGEGWSDEDRYRERWHNCRTIDDARQCVKAAEDELESWRKSKAQEPETSKQVNQRIVKTGEGWDAREVAATLRVTMKMVYAARFDAGRDYAKGLPIAGVDERELARRGNSTRQIAELMKSKPTTVFKRLKKAA